MQPIEKVNNLRLRTKLLVVYFGLSILLFTSGGLGALYLIEKAVKSNIENDLRNGTHTIINLVETTVQGSIVNYLRAVAERNLEITRMIYGRQLSGELTESQARRAIREILLSQTIGKTGYIYCIDSRGIATVHPNPGVEGNNWIRFAFVRRQTQLKSGYLEYDWRNPGEATARPKALFMTYFAPYDWIISVSSYRDEFRELIPMEEIRKSVKDLKYGTSGYVFICDRQGNVIVHPELEGRNLAELAGRDTAFFETMVAEEFGRITYRWRNSGETKAREKLAIFGYIPELEWVVGSTVYLDEIHAPVRQARMIAATFIGVAVSLSMILTTLISNSITRRLRHLTAVITKGDQGDLTVRVNPGGDDEIGRLGLIFNGFLERLQSSRSKLRAEIDRHQATAKSLREAMDFNALILSTVEALVIVLDAEGRVVSFNRACQECSGYSSEEVEGRHIHEKLIPEDELEDVQAIFSDLIENKGGRHYTNHWNTKQGQRRLIQWSNAVATGKDGQVDLVVSAGLDITDQKATESALAKSEAQFEAVFNQTFQFIGLLSPDGTLISANQTALDFAGVEKAHVVGLKLWETPFWRHSEAVQKELKAAVRRARQGEFIRMELTQIREDEEIRVVDFSIKPFTDDSGQVIMLIPEGRDITEKKRMEAQLLQSQKMDAIGTLAGGIAHDFNNNLQAISGYAQLLLMDGYGSNKHKDMLTTILHACDHARELTHQLLTFSRKIESRLSPLDLNAELLNVTKLLQRTLPRMIDIKTILADDLRIIQADHVQLEQVVMNLGINAGHAMPDGGTLTIETKNVDLDEGYCRTHLGAEPGRYAMLAITDTGQGMDASTREHIFEPFFTTRETGEGTGLGLAMVYGIVKNHKGYITCDSESGKGTVFKIYFPAATGGHAIQAPAEDREKIQGGDESIMIVDDDGAIRQLARILLERFGYRVCEAADGESALALYARMGSSPDLILLDLNMPGMGGTQCLQALKRIDAVLPVLIASGYTPNGQTKSTLDELAQGFVSKPYELKDLLAAVRKTLDQARTSEYS